MLSLRLTVRQFWVRRVRTALTVLAIAFAVSMVVAVTSGFASLSAVATRMMDKFAGSTDVTITAREVTKKSFVGSVLGDVRRDGRVRVATGRYETNSPLLDVEGKAVPDRPAGLVGLVPEEDRAAKGLTFVEGKWFEGTGGDGAVVNDNAARAMKTPMGAAGPEEKWPRLKVGDTFELPGPSGNLKLRVVGVVHQPLIAGNTVYAPIDTLRHWAAPGKGEVLSRISIEVNKGVDLKVFEEEWSAKLKAVDPAIKVKLARANKEQLEKNLMGLELLSAMGVSISLVSAACIVFSTLSMGVAERQRQLAMLRAVGATRAFVGRLVVEEGVSFALMGTAAGVPLGLFWVKLLTLKYPAMFSEGVVVAWAGVLYSLGACLVTALVATVLPAWHATRVSPLEAMSVIADGEGGGAARAWPWRTALLGVAFCLLDPIDLSDLIPWVVGKLGVADGASLARGIQFWGHFVAGGPGTLIGFFLFSPLVVRVVEVVMSGMVARVAGLPPALLRQQLAAGLWRAAGTACALMVGLATLVVMQTQGRSALGAWKLPDKFPDVFILNSGTRALTEADIEKLGNIPEIVKGDLMPVAIASPMFGNNFLAIMGAAAMPDSTLFFGVDPEQCRRMTELEFRVGDPDSAVAMLKKGRHVLVTEEYRQITGATVGDTVPLLTRQGMVKFEIAGVVWSPGIDVMVSAFDLGGQFDQRTAYSVFGTMDDARELFGVKDISIFAANLQPGVQRDELTKQLQQEVGKMGLRAFDIRQVKATIHSVLSNLLLMASSVAFAALFVASLGVTNTIMASIRSRRWQFGVLRAVGTTRGQLVRLVVAESMMLAVVGCVLGLGCGAYFTVNARNVTRVFIGLYPDVVIPWGMLGVGVGAVLAVGLLASLWPARSTSRRPVLELLQAGRASS